MKGIERVKQWIAEASDEAPAIADLTERDLINLYEASCVYTSWARVGRDGDILDYWGNPSPQPQDWQDLKRGFQLLKHFTTHAFRPVPKFMEAPVDGSPLVFIVVPSGYVAMQEQHRAIGFYDRSENTPLTF